MLRGSGWKIVGGNTDATRTDGNMSLIRIKRDSDLYPLTPASNEMAGNHPINLSMKRMKSEDIEVEDRDTKGNISTMLMNGTTPLSNVQTCSTTLHQSGTQQVTLKPSGPTLDEVVSILGLKEYTDSLETDGHMKYTSANERVKVCDETELENSDGESEVKDDDSGSEDDLREPTYITDERSSTRRNGNPDIDFLVRTLSKCRQFTSSLENISRYKNLSESSIKELVDKYPGIFNLKERSIELKPRLNVCKAHCSHQGCRNREHCRDLHICMEYVREKCQDSDCAFGHRWNTGHNHSILTNLFISGLNSQILQKLVMASGNLSALESHINVCSDYNNDGCFASDCPSLHICSSFLVSLANGIVCKCKDSCLRNHDITSSFCISLLSKHGLPTNEAPRDIALAILLANPSLYNEARGRRRKRKLKRKSSGSDSDDGKTPTTVWSHYLKGDVDISEICYHSVENMCPSEESGCQRLHATAHFHWQVSEQGNDWFNLRPAQVKRLERAYCDPAKDSVVLPRLDPATLEHSLTGLFVMMGRDFWSSDFYSMTLSNLSGNKKLHIRRLCTENIQNVLVKPSTFVWYFLDQNNKWVLYGASDTLGNALLTSSVTSSQIEAAYLQNSISSIRFSNAQFQYILDFQQMMQVNQTTRKFRQVMRRPEAHLQDEEMEDLPEIWRVMYPSQRVQRVALCDSSPDYKKVIQLLNLGQVFQFKWINIERIQNPYLWRAYQNKINEMTTVYGGVDAVDIQYLFHGTMPDTVRSICEENFDWRLNGTKNGRAFGCGTYFTSNPQYAASYSRPDRIGHYFMFVAQVAVGTKTVGNPAMTRPPINQATNLPFDSTINSLINPHIYVKYDKQEYYPEFLVMFCP